MYVTSIMMLLDKGHDTSDFLVWMSLGSMMLMPWSCRDEKD